MEDINKIAIKNFLNKTTLLFVGIAIATVTSSLIAGVWNSPPVGTVPPANNTAAPLNVGNSTQTKDGILTVLGFKSWGPATIVSTTTDDYSMPTSLLFGVNGSVGAKEYCDETGSNCFDISNHDWQTPVMGYNWSKFPSFYYTRYFKDNENIVHIKGSLIEMYNFPTSYPMFILPVGYRPSEDIIIPITIGKQINFSSNSSISYTTGSLQIEAGGNVSVIDKAGFTIPAVGDLRYYFGSISFRADN